MTHYYVLRSTVELRHCKLHYTKKKASAIVKIAKLDFLKSSFTKANSAIVCSKLFAGGHRLSYSIRRSTVQYVYIRTILARLTHVHKLLTCC